jgi:hypothetical protein
VEFGLEDTRIMPLSNGEFRENQHSESHTLRGGVHEFLSVLLTRLIWVKFDIRDLHIMLFTVCDFCENRPREGCAFLMGINEISLCVPLNHMTV